MVVYQNGDVVSLCDPGPILRDHPVCGKGSRPGVLGLMTLVKAFNIPLGLSFLLPNSY